MTNITIYKLAGGQTVMHGLLCQLLQKAQSRNQQVLCQLPDQAAVDVLDDHLWSFEPTAFIPHGKGIDQAPIALSCADEPGEHHHILINLLPSIPTWFSRFERVIEIIYQDEQFQQSKRDNFLFYKQRGYPLEFHDLSDKFFD